MKYLLALLISTSALLAETGTMLRVSVWDETEKKPPHAKAEIWFKGNGSWFIAPDIKFGSGAKELGRRPVGKKDMIFFYPEGRSGAEIKISVSPTEEMNPKGSHRDTLAT